MYYSYDNNTKKIRGKLWFCWSALWAGTAYHGKITAYKKENGKWKNDRTPWMRVIIDVDYYSKRCRHKGNIRSSAAFNNRHSISCQTGVEWKRKKTKKGNKFKGQFQWGNYPNYTSRSFYY